MSTLTLSILALVVVVVGLVVAYNLWQGHSTRKARELNRRLTKGHFDPAPADAPLGARRLREEAPRVPRWKSTAVEADATARDRREPTMDADDVAAVAGITRAAIDRMGGRDLQAPVGAGADGDRHGRNDPEDGLGHDVPTLQPLHAIRDDIDDDEGYGDRAPAKVAQTDGGRGPGRFVARYEDRGGHHVDDESGDVDPVSVGGPLRSPAQPGPDHDNGLPGDALAAPVRAAVATRAPRESVREAVSPVGERMVTAGAGAAAAASDAASAVAEADDPVPVHDEAAVDVPARPEEAPQADVEHSVVIRPVSPVNAERLIALTSSFRHIGGKAVRIEVDQALNDWAPLKSGGKVKALRLSIVLANRQGPLNPVELSDFTATVESLATQLQAPCATVDMAPVLRDARDLDALAARLDTQLDLTVECPDGVSPRGLATLARQLELHDRGAGRYAAFADDGDPLFTMMAGEAPDLVVFVLDVPRTARHHQAWRAMVATASGCSQAARGRLVDSTGRGLSVGMIESIERQLEDRYRELARVGLPAGSPAALRVFG